MTFPLIIIAALVTIVIIGAILETIEANADKADDAIGFTYDDDAPPYMPDKEIDEIMSGRNRLKRIMTPAYTYMLKGMPIDALKDEEAGELADAIERNMRAAARIEKKQKLSGNPPLEINK